MPIIGLQDRDDREANSGVIVGADGTPLQQDREQKLINRQGAASGEADYDIIKDIGDTDFETGSASIGGASEFSGAIESQNGLQFSVKIHWQDEDGNTLYMEEPPGAQNTTDTVIVSVAVKSDFCNVRVTDESGQATNNVTGTINFH